MNRAFVFRPGKFRWYVEFGMFFGVEDPETDFCWRTFIEDYDVDKNRAFVTKAIERGMYYVSPGRGPAPSHCGFSVQHSKEDLYLALEKIDEIFHELR